MIVKQVFHNLLLRASFGVCTVLSIAYNSINYLFEELVLVSDFFIMH